MRGYSDKKNKIFILNLFFSLLQEFGAEPAPESMLTITTPTTPKVTVGVKRKGSATITTKTIAKKVAN